MNICLSQTGKELVFSVGFITKAQVIIRLYFQRNEREGGEQRNNYKRQKFLLRTTKYKSKFLSVKNKNKKIK